MSLELKRALLTTLYEVYDKTAKQFPAACSRDCDTCCTHNVVATTLEVELIRDHLQQIGRADLELRALQDTSRRRLRPRLTINELATFCLRREEPPDQAEEFHVEPCPIREEDGCPVYEVRPFACRSLWSEQACAVTGEAVMAPLLLTLNGVFEQIVEDIDAGGLCGNMLDLFSFLHANDRSAAYRSGACLEPEGFLRRTRPNPGFIVPPPHRQWVQSVLNVLWQRRVTDVSFRDALKTIRVRRFDEEGQT